VHHQAKFCQNLSIRCGVIAIFQFFKLSAVLHLERVMNANKDLKGGIAVHGISNNNLRFADDIEASSSSLQEAAQLLNEQGKRLGLVIN